MQVQLPPRRAKLDAHLKVPKRDRFTNETGDVVSWKRYIFYHFHKEVMAHLLAKLGREALLPQKVNNIWQKAKISAKNVARLRKEALLDGR